MSVIRLGDNRVTKKRPYVMWTYHIVLEKRKCKAQVDLLSRKRPEDLMTETGKVMRRTGHPGIEFIGRSRSWAVMSLRKEKYNHI
ncbi:hypothetical protein TNCV_516401 [Trichonephila clavipes]|nr:hypothetical protein TNCV_516401 [Trichonephila clavipes]